MPVNPISDIVPQVTADGLSLECWITAALAASVTKPIYGDDDPDQFEGWWAEIPICRGAWGFGSTPDEARRMLAETLDDWVTLEIDAGHEIPEFCGLRVTANR